MEGYRQVATWMKALAHPARLRILEVLAEEGEACVCHLENRLDQRQAYISQHLARLREAGLVQDRRDGLNVFYSVSMEEIEQLLETAKQLAVQMGRARGAELEFRGIHRIDPQDCRCPRCEERLAMSTVN